MLTTAIIGLLAGITIVSLAGFFFCQHVERPNAEAEPRKALQIKRAWYIDCAVAFQVTELGLSPSARSKFTQG